MKSTFDNQQKEHNKHDSVKKASGANLINKAMTLEPLGSNRRDGQNLLATFYLS